MRLKYSIAFVLLSLCGIITFAQNTPVWTGVYQGNGDNSDRFNKIIADGTGNFIAVGYTVKKGNHRDILTVKFDSNGDTLWWRTKNGKANGDDSGVSLGVDASGFVYVTGYVDNDKSNSDIIVIKYDASGTVQWDTTWDSPASLDDIPVDLKIDGSGNCLVGGNSEPDTVSGSSDYVVVKFAPNGAIVWSYQYSRSGVTGGKDELSGIDLDVADDAYVTGRSFNNTNDDFVTIKVIGSSGLQSWLQSYNGGNNDRATAIVVDNTGNVIITGRSDNGSDFDYRTIKYDNAGLLQWTRLYNAPVSEDDRPIAIAVDASDNVIVTGISDVDGSSFTNFDFQTVMYNSSGTLQWVARTGNVVSQDDEPTGIAVDASGNIFVTGRTDMNPGSGIADYDFMTVMYNTSGVLQWLGQPLYHNGTRVGGDDVAYSLIADGGYVYVVGASNNNVTQKDATCIKYDVATGNATWVKNYNGDGDFSENGKALVVDASNMSYSAGYSFVENQNLNGCIAKFDQAGDTICNYMYNGLKNDDDEFTAMAIATNGIIYTAGYTKVTGQKSNILLVKWDPATCDTIWTRTYDYVNQSDKAESIVLDGAGNIYLTGKSDANPVDTSDNNDIVTIKYDSNGNQLWIDRFDGVVSLRDEPIKIILDNNGDVIVAGRTENIHDDDFFVIKYNSSNGNRSWANPIIYNGPFSNDDRVTDITVDASNNIFICGYSQTSSAPSLHDPVILKYDASGNQQAFFSYNGEGQNEEPVKLAVDISNNIYCTFNFDTQSGLSSDSYNILLKKFDNQLADLWTTSSPQYNSPINGDDSPTDLKISPAGEIFVTGKTDNDTSGGRVNTNWITIGYNDQGIQTFISNFNGPNSTDDVPNSIVIRGNVMWVGGYTEGMNFNQKDITINNYNLTTYIVDYPNDRSSLVFPNPFSNKCTIVVPGLEDSSTSLFEVYDMSGSRILYSQKYTGAVFSFSKGDLASGVYQFRLISNENKISYGKIVIN
jgi:uncharacterized delta-60 repeat protein